jgi:hypothetical protein
VITLLPPKAMFTGVYFCGDIIPKVVEEMLFVLANSPRQPTLHMDNANSDQARESIACLKESRTRPTDYRASSPNLGPFDCYLIGTLKSALSGQGFESIEKLLLAIRGVSDFIERAELVPHYILSVQTGFSANRKEQSRMVQYLGYAVAAGCV